MASEHIKRNTYYTFVFNSSDAKSVYRACLHLQLDLRCQRMLSSLLPGQCIFRPTQASWNNAMWCKMDFIEPARNLGAIEYESQPYTPAVSLSDVPQVLDNFNAAVEEYRNARKRQTDDKTSELDQYAMKLLRLRIKNPYAPVARLFDAIGKVRFEAQVAIREMLETKDLAEFEEIRIGRSNVLLMDVTGEGYKVVGLPVPDENKGRGSISHRHFAHWIKIHFEKKGHKAYVEWVIPGTNHPVDAAVQSKNKWTVYEVCVTAFDNVLSHIKACFENGSDVVERLTIVVATKTKLKELKKRIQSDFLFTLYTDKVDFDVIQNYVIKELEKNESD